MRRTRADPLSQRTPVSSSKPYKKGKLPTPQVIRMCEPNWRESVLFDQPPQWVGDSTLPKIMHVPANVDSTDKAESTAQAAQFDPEPHRLHESMA
jgi:hypothetical protein